MISSIDDLLSSYRAAATTPRDKGTCFERMNVMACALIMVGTLCGGAGPSYAEGVTQGSLTLHVRAPVWMRLVGADGTVLSERIHDTDDRVKIDLGQTVTARIGDVRNLEFCFADACFIASSGAPVGPVAVELTWPGLTQILMPRPGTSDSLNHGGNGPLYFDPDLGAPGSSIVLGAEHGLSGVAITR